jgi:hypothetical protein
MQEIIRVTADRNTLYMRIPRMFKKQKGIKRGDYLVCNFDGIGEMKIHTWEDEKIAKSRIEERSSNQDQ